MITLRFQLIAAGVLDKADYPDFEEETGILPKDDDSGKCLFKPVVRLYILEFIETRGPHN